MANYCPRCNCSDCRVEQSNRSWKMQRDREENSRQLRVRQDEAGIKHKNGCVDGHPKWVECTIKFPPKYCELCEKETNHYMRPRQYDNNYTDLWRCGECGYATEFVVESFSIGPRNYGSDYGGERAYWNPFNYNSKDRYAIVGSAGTGRGWNIKNEEKVKDEDHRKELMKKAIARHLEKD